MINKSAVQFALSFGFLLLLLLGCSDSKPKYRIGVSQCSSDAWRNQMNFEMRREASFFDGVQLEILSAQDNSETQKSQIRNLIHKGVDLLIVSPNETQPITDVVGEAFRKGIPVVVVDRKIQTEDYSAYVGADNVKIGQNVAQYILSSTIGKCCLIELRGLDGSSAAMERHFGFESALKKSSSVSRLASVDGMWKADRAQILTDSLLRCFPATDVIFAHNDAMARGAYAAVSAQGKTKKVRIVGVDALPGPGNGIEMVEDGRLDATFIYPTGGDKVIQTAMDILYGRSFSRKTELQTSLITKSNVGLVTLQQQRIRDLDSTIEHLNDRVGLSLKAISDKNSALWIMIVLLFSSLILLALLMRAFVVKKKMNSDLLRQQSQLSQQNAQLIQQRDKLLDLSSQLEEIAQTKLNFYTNVSHDLRTPVSMICNPIEQMLEDRTLTDSQRSLLSTAQKSSMTLLKLLDQILDLRKLDEGASHLNAEQTDLCSLMMMWNETVEVTARTMGLTFVFTCDMGMDYKVNIDVEKLERVYLNLMSNALKFTPSGGKIEVLLLRDERLVEFRVVNSGSYIPTEDLDKVFDRFYTSESEHSGTGIGLSLVKAFVELHSGSVSVFSDKVKGTAFSVQLPACTVSDENSSVEGRASAQMEEEGRVLILLVDDNADIRHYLNELLCGKYIISEACDGEQGMQMALKLIPDLIISDVMMPRLDGVQMCHRLKQNFATCHIPIILLTAKALDSQRIEGYQSGADSYICKPFSSKLLLSRIENLLASRLKITNLFSPDSLVQNFVCEKDVELLTKMREIVERRLDDSSLSATLIGKELGMSRTQFYRKLCSISDCTPNDYILNARIERAKILLSNARLSISQVCYSVGFSSPSYFAKCFREREGITPKEFCKRAMK